MHVRASVHTKALCPRDVRHHTGKGHDIVTVNSCMDYDFLYRDVTRALFALCVYQDVGVLHTGGSPLC